MKFYYLHIQAAVLLVGENGTGADIELDSVTTDSVFQSIGFWGTDKLKTQFLKKSEYKIQYKKIADFKYGANVLDVISRGVANDLPKYLYKINFLGIPGQDAIGVYSNAYLIVSEKALAALRNEGVVKAEADLIDVSIEEYFATNRQFFWMPEPLRTKFLERFVKKQSP